MWNAEIVSQCDSELISQPEFSWILYFYFIHTSWPLIGHETCRDIVFRVFPLISGVQCRVTPLDGAVSISHTAWRTDDAQAWPAISEGLWNNLKAASSKSTNKCLNERKKKKTLRRVSDSQFFQENGVKCSLKRFSQVWSQVWKLYLLQQLYDKDCQIDTATPHFQLFHDWYSMYVLHPAWMYLATWDRKSVV